MKSFFIAIALLCCTLCGCSQDEKGGYEKKFIIARDPSWGNLPLMGRNAHLRAFSDELLHAIAKEEGFAIEIRQAATEGLFYGLNTGSFDGVLSAQPPHASQKALYLFSTPYFPLGPVLITPLASTETELSNFKGKKIGMLRNSDAIVLLGKDPTVFIDQYNNNLLGLDALVAGDIDGFIMGRISANYYCTNNYAGILKVATKPLTDEALRLVTLRTASGDVIQAKFNEGLKAVRENGTVDFLLAKWGFAPLLYEE